VEHKSDDVAFHNGCVGVTSVCRGDCMEGFGVEVLAGVSYHLPPILLLSPSSNTLDAPPAAFSKTRTYSAPSPLLHRQCMRWLLPHIYHECARLLRRYEAVAPTGLYMDMGGDRAESLASRGKFGVLWCLFEVGWIQVSMRGIEIVYVAICRSEHMTMLISCRDPCRYTFVHLRAFACLTDRNDT